MSILDSFKTFDFSEGVPYVSITRNGITFNKSVVAKLGYPKFVLLLIDEVSKQIAIQVSDDTADKATSFYKPKKSNVVSVRWNGKDLLNTLQGFMGWDLEKEAFKIEGALIKEENAMLFDLKNAVELK